MTLQDIGLIDLGFEFRGLGGNPTDSAITNDAAGEAWAFAFQVPKTGNIDRVLFRTGTVTTAANMAVTLETIGTDGLPSGSNYGGSAGVTWSPVDSDDNVTVELTLGTPAAATIGDIVVLRGEWSGSAGNLQIGYLTGSAGSGRGWPKVLPDTGSGFTLSTDGIPKVCLRYDDGTYCVPLGCVPPGGTGSINIASGSTPQEVGIWLNLPVAATIIGVKSVGRTFGTTQTNTLSLYTTPGGTPASQRSVAPNHNQLSLTNDWNCLFFNGYDISASTDYVLGFLQSSTNNLTLYYYDVANANYWGGFAGGSYFTWASRNSGGGAFTQTTTRKLVGSVAISKIHDGAGGGGGNANILGGSVIR